MHLILQVNQLISNQINVGVSLQLIIKWYEYQYLICYSVFDLVVPYSAFDLIIELVIDFFIMDNRSTVP